MEIGEESELFKVASETLGADIIIGSKVDSICEICKSSRGMRVRIASFVDDSHVVLSNSKYLLIHLNVSV